MSLNMVSEYMSASDIICLPSHNEGVPNVLLEAKACAKPVVATSVGGIPEIVSSNDGMLVEKHDITHLSRTLVMSLNKKWNENDIMNESKKYTWNINVNNVSEVIEKILKTS